MKLNMNCAYFGFASRLFLAMCLAAIPALADGPCQDVSAAARFASSIPQISSSQLQQGAFTVAEQGQYTGRFIVSFSVNQQRLFQRNVYERDSDAGGLQRILPARINGFNALGFLYSYGASGRIGCVIVVFPFIQKDSTIVWRTSDPDYDGEHRDKWYTLKKGEIPPMPPQNSRSALKNQSPQDSINAFINAHFTKCGESSYLFEYAGINMFVGIRELRQLTATFTLAPVSEVDKLNGLEGKGTLRLTATANRFHPREGQWSEWKQGFATFHSEFVGGQVGQEIANQSLPMISKKGVWQVQAPLEIEQSKPTTCNYFAQLR